jgi:hypothetical protein
MKSKGKSMNDLRDLITPAWLTEMLRKHTHLHRRAVVRLHDVQFVDYLNSVQAYIHATVDASSPLPEHLLLKVTKPHIASAARREVMFYQQIAPLLTSVPLVRAYATGTLEDKSRYVLLEDVSSIPTTLLPTSCSHAELRGRSILSIGIVTGSGGEGSISPL